MHDPYVVAWKMKSKEKLIDENVEHLPKEVSWAAWFFLEQGGKISGNVFEEKYGSSLIPKGGLEIILEVELKIEDKRKILERFQDVTENNYQSNENTGYYSIYDPAVLSLQQEEKDHLVDDEKDDAICLDWV